MIMRSPNQTDLGKCGDKSFAISVNPTVSLSPKMVFNLSSHMICFLFSGFYNYKTDAFFKIPSSLNKNI